MFVSLVVFDFKCFFFLFYYHLLVISECNPECGREGVCVKQCVNVCKCRSPLYEGATCENRIDRNPSKYQQSVHIQVSYKKVSDRKVSDKKVRDNKVSDQKSK